MMPQNRDILIVAEAAHGELKASSLELFTAARQISLVTNGRILAAIVGAATHAAAEEAAGYGANKCICVENAALEKYSTALYAEAYCRLIKKYSPDVVILPASKNGKDLAPRIARRLATGITANCTELSVDPETGLVSWNMPAPGGIMATILCRDSRPQMGSIVPGAFRKEQVPRDPDFEIIDEEIVLEKEDPVKVIRFAVADSTQGTDIAAADIVVAGGRGMGSAENFELLFKLASLLGGAVGASRAATDAEWVDHRCLVGQTGKLIRPKLYIACGISGALQHLVGIAGAECVIAINNDKSAPIFEVADYSGIGDAPEILRALIAELENN